VEEFVSGTLRLRPWQAADDAAIAAIINGLRPSLPAVPVDRLSGYRARRAQGGHDEVWVATLNGEVAGWLRLTHLLAAEPPVTYAVAIQVAAHLRRGGIGTTLYYLLQRRLTDTGAERLAGQVYEDDMTSLRFVQQRGFQTTGPDERDWRLAVDRAVLDGFRGVEERLALAEGIRIERLADLAARPDIIAAARDMPTRRAGETAHPPGSIRRVDDQWNDYLFGGEDVLPEWSWVALDGDRPVGVAYVNRVTETSAANQFTGVHPNYQGRGIARALKMRVVDWARANGVAWLYTGNDATNTRMLEINARMGYTPLPAPITCTRPVGCALPRP
jgi:GNAT superfamily N-acetyltransferase